MTHGGGGVSKIGPKSVTYYLKGPLYRSHPASFFPFFSKNEMKNIMKGKTVSKKTSFKFRLIQSTPVGVHFVKKVGLFGLRAL